MGTWSMGFMRLLRPSPLWAGAALPLWVMASVLVCHSWGRQPLVHAHDTRVAARQFSAQGSQSFVHLRVAVTNESGRVILQREEWEALAPESAVAPNAPRWRNPIVLTKFRWMVEDAHGQLQEQWWSSDTFHVRMSYEVHTRRVDIYHAVAGRPFLQPISEFAVPAPSNVGLRALLYGHRGQALPNTTVNGAPVSVIGDEGLHNGIRITDIYYLSKATQRLLREVIVIAPKGKPVLTRVFTLKSYEVLPPAKVPSYTFDPPLPTRVSVSSHY